MFSRFSFSQRTLDMGAEPAQAPTPARDPAPQGGANGTDDGLAEVGAALAARRPITQGEFDTYVRTLRGCSSWLSGR